MQILLKLKLEGQWVNGELNRAAYFSSKLANQAEI